MNEGYAIFLNDDGSETKLTWDELKLEENGEKYGYKHNEIKDTSINRWAFYGCEKIKEINAPEGVKYIGDNVFLECYQLEKVTLPSTLKEIGDAAFCGAAIKEINVPEGVNRIEKDVFHSCEQLEKVILPSTLKEIDSDAFYDTAIKKLVILNSVKYVGRGAFGECKQLEKIIAPKGLYIPDEIHNGIKVERTNEECFYYQKYLKKAKEYIKEPKSKELNNVQFTANFLDIFGITWAFNSI